MATEPNTNNQQITTNGRANSQSTTNNHQQLLVRSPKLVVRSYKLLAASRQSFTLIEILVTVALIAVLAVAIILSLNPSELIKQARDSTRLSDIQNLNKSLSWFEADTGGNAFMGTSSVVYVSIPDTTSTCANLGLPPLSSGWSYNCVSSSTLQKTDGTGWIPIDFRKQSFGKTLTKLPIDPINQTSTGNYYTYTYNQQTGKYEINTRFESTKRQELALSDGGDNDNVYEQGQSLSLMPNSIYQTNSNVWLKTFGGTNDDRNALIQQTSDGGYIIGASTASFGAGNNDALIIKLDSSGNISWSKTIGGANNDYIYSIQQTSDGGYIIGGSTRSFGAGNFDALIIKLDSSGNISWSKTIGGGSNEEVYSIQQTSDGGYIIGGYTRSFGAGSYDALIVKLDSSGNISWSKTIGGIYHDDVYSIQQTSDGGYIIGGYTNSFGPGDYDALIVKLDSSGNISWLKTIGGIDYDYIASIQQTSDGGYLVGGGTNSFGAGSSDALIVKLDSSGNISWSKTIGGIDYDYISSIQQTSDGGYIIGGYTYSFGAGSQDALIAKLDSSGNISWSKTIGGTDYDYIYSIQQTSDGGYIIGGDTNSFGAGYYDALIVKLDSSGNCGNCSFIQSVNPTVISISPTVNSPSPTTTSITPTVNSPSPTVTSPTPTVNTYCPQ